MSNLFGLGRRGLSISVAVGLVGLTAVPVSCGGADRTYGDGDDSSAGAPGGRGDTGGSDMGGNDTGGTAPTGGSGNRGGTGGASSGAGGAPEGGTGNEGGTPDAGAGNEGGAESGAGGTGGMSGTSGGGAGGCTFVSAENCFNNRDDDCNGSVDAADTACASSTQCVPAATNFDMGILLGAGTTCPAAYADSELGINRGLNAGAGCTGCSCSATVQCRAQVFEYSTLASCDTDTALTGGTSQGFVGPTDMCLNANPLITGPGFRVGAYQTTSGACVPAGTATRSTPTWAEGAKFCGTDLVGGGCSPGNVAIPVTTERRCVIALGSNSCPTGYLAERNPWYTGFDDTRTCGACTCGTQTPGDCTRTATGSQIFVQLYAGTGETCSAGIHRSAGSNAKNCTVLTTSGPFNSMGFSSASPLLPSCPPVSAVGGTLTPTSQYTLCCSL